MIKIAKIVITAPTVEKIELIDKMFCQSLEDYFESILLMDAYNNKFCIGNETKIELYKYTDGKRGRPPRLRDLENYVLEKVNNV